VQHRRRITAAEDRKVVVRTAEAFRLGSRQRGGETGRGKEVGRSRSKRRRRSGREAQR
jgi:hypothetical protein